MCDHWNDQTHQPAASWRQATLRHLMLGEVLQYQLVLPVSLVLLLSCCAHFFLFHLPRHPCIDASGTASPRTSRTTSNECSQLPTGNGSNGSPMQMCVHSALGPSCEWSWGALIYALINSQWRDAQWPSSLLFWLVSRGSGGLGRYRWCALLKNL